MEESEGRSTTEEKKEEKREIGETTTLPYGEPRAKDVYKVTTGQEPPRPPHEPGSIKDAPPKPAKKKPRDQIGDSSDGYMICICQPNTPLFCLLRRAPSVSIT
ncbi:hypothetical protein RJ641_035198 [Dillenia turbinata]|uniref:Uncharacterized protein n=1 Tax=Dillenia turbinata TaxID=194707 RepID=A0AAN8ZIA5_9MAGN